MKLESMTGKNLSITLLCTPVFATKEDIAGAFQIWDKETKPSWAKRGNKLKPDARAMESAHALLKYLAIYQGSK